MSITTGELIAYGATSRPVTDSGTVGGAIDLTDFIDFTQMTGNDTIQAVSSSAGDTTQTITVVGRDAAGNVVTSSATTLTGTTPVTISGLGTVERILSATLSATAAGTVTVRSTTGPGTNFSRTIPVGQKSFRAVFQQGASLPGSTKTYYAKFFWKNTDATLALTSAQVLESADPSGLIDHGLEGTLNDSNTSTNRITAPGGITFASTAANVANSQSLTAGAAQGTWLRLSLGVGQAAQRTTYTSQLTGNST
jgi:hypothetical protein